MSVDEYTETWGRLRGVVVQRHGARSRAEPDVPPHPTAPLSEVPQYPTEAALGDGDSIVIEITPWRVYARGFD